VAISRSASTPFRLICATLTSPDLPREGPLFMATNTQPIEVIARLLDLTERRVTPLARDGGQRRRRAVTRRSIPPVGMAIQSPSRGRPSALSRCWRSVAVTVAGNRRHAVAEAPAQVISEIPRSSCAWVLKGSFAISAE
jgi:hypothetical protein